MTNAKLAIAFAKGNEDGDFADVQTIAKIRCAMIEANGNDWFDGFVKDNLFIRSLLNVYVGKKCELVLDVLQAPNFNEDTLVGIKKALDLLADRNDTLYFCPTFQDIPDTETVSEITSRHSKHRLKVGELKGRMLPLLLNFRSNALGKEYEEICQSQGRNNLKDKYIRDGNIDEDDLKLFIECLCKSDKCISQKELKSKYIITDYSYEHSNESDLDYQKDVLQRVKIAL